MKTFSKDWTDEERMKIVLLLAGQIQSDIPAGLYGAPLEYGNGEDNMPTKFRPNMQSIQNVIAAPKDVLEAHRADFEALVTDAMGAIGRDRDEFFEPLDREKWWSE